MKPRVLITGGTGFIGSYAVEEFLKAGWTVRAFIRNPQRLTWLAGLPIETSVGRMEDRASLAAAVEGCHTVVHCAGLTKARTREELFRANALTVEDFAAVAQQADVKRFILCSSQAASGPSTTGQPSREDEEAKPISDYGRSKLEGECRLRAAVNKMEWVILRPPAVMGPRDEQFIPLFRAVTRYGIYPRFGSSEQSYSFISVYDLARALLLAAKADTGLNEVYFTASPEALNWSEAAQTIARLTGKKVRPLPISEFLLRTVGAMTSIAAKMRGEPALLNSDKIDEILLPGWICSSEKIFQTWNFRCAWSPEQTLRDTYNGYREAGRL
ncbi:NAD-dependent epimerase/dehydratase family protein [candidate division KSB1 bacterium]|nr:MAG: NAD-dependent epimerase/dehydratase family protein [candidate division KSB1 bacterium]